ncbi:MAG: U32 family peptidase [Ignavibacteriales bacterium]|nr:U32 family peptidase [Ignavibacteriales bacterium]
MNNILHKPELMAPAGDWTMLRAAVSNGADAVYFGLDKLNMRAKAANFTVEELPSIISFCAEYNVKTYLTINTIVFEEELSDLEEIIIAAKKNDVDRIICSDLAVADLCYKHQIPFCISTQSSISNSLAADVYKRMGAVRIVLARECSIDEIKKIRAKTDLEIEAFIHGAMCIAVSGRCFMSHHLFGKSANRGECVQPCRREYEVYDPSINKSLIVGEDYIMSPKDLCTIEFIDQLIEAGIDSFKIEGRKRAPEYVAKVVSVYRQAIDLYFAQRDGKQENLLTEDKKKELLEELEKVYNRGFSSGFYFDTPSSEEYAGVHGSRATTRKVYVGKVLNYFKDIEIAHIILETGELNSSDNILIIGETTGVIEIKIEMMNVNDKMSATAKKGDEITLKILTLVRRNDKVYLIKSIDISN